MFRLTPRHPLLSLLTYHRPHLKVRALKGNPYKLLRTFVHDTETIVHVEISAATKKVHKERRAPLSPSEHVYFHVLMKVQPRAGDGKARWVLREHEQAWRDQVRNAPKC